MKLYKAKTYVCTVKQLNTMAAKNVFVGELKLDKNKYKEMLKQLKEFEIRNSDVFLIGYPKSGTTWVQEMVWLILNDFNYEGAKVFVNERVPILESCGWRGTKVVPNLNYYDNSIEFAKSVKDPRCMKIHLKWECLPEQILNNSKQPKVIYIARNPKDVCVSAYYFLKHNLKATNSSWEEFIDGFLNSYITEEHGSYWENVLSFWKQKDRPNILFITYEDMKKDLSDVIHKVATFLGKSVPKEQEEKLLKWLDFETMKNNAAVNCNNITNFMRKGKIGEHKNLMSEEIIKKFDLWTEKNLQGTDYKL